jgi:hypothetical protein
MKALRVVLPLALGGAVLLLALSRLGARGGAEAYVVEHQALQREMLERSAVARGLAGAPGAEEAREVVRWWVDAFAALQNRHPGAHAQERPAASGEKKGSEKKGDEAEFRRYAQERLDALRGGYAPVLSASEQGMRLDLLSIRPAEHPQSRARALRVDFALWGAPRRFERESAAASGGARAQARVVVPVAFRQLAFRFVDAAGKTYGESSGAGDPYLALRDPDRFGDALPPGIIFGTWWFDPFPREAARVEMTVAVQAQGTSSAVLSPTFRWDVPVPEEWKLRPGEVFHSETREAPPEAAPPAR